jgi:VanZ family protein
MHKNKKNFDRFTILNNILNPRITRWLFLIFWIYALFLLVMNLTPGNTQPLEMKKIMFVRSDYFFHAAAYLILSSLFIMSALSSRPVFMHYNTAAGIAVLLLLATVPEFLQNYVPQRRFNWWDMFANFTGLALGTLGMLSTIKICRKQNRTHFEPHRHNRPQ